MNFCNKYNLMIELIEENAELRTSDIGEIISRSLGISPRTAYDVFKFLTDFTFAEYIGIRRLEWVFDYKRKTECSWTDAASHYGEDYSSYFRRFKARFGVSPSDALNAEDSLSFIKPLYIEELLKIIDANEVQKMTVEREYQMLNTVQITYEQCEIFDTIQRFQSLYGFENKEIVEAFNLSQKYDIPLETLCECISQDKFLSKDLVEEEEKPFFSEDVICKTAELAKEYSYSFLSVYLMIANGHSEEFVRMVLAFDISVEDGELFVESMYEDSLGWDNVTEEIMRLFFSTIDLCSFGNYQFSVGTCKEILDAAEKLDVNVYDDLAALELLASHYEGSAYELVADYKDYLDSVFDDLDDGGEVQNHFVEKKTEEQILDEMARARGDDF